MNNTKEEVEDRNTGKVIKKSSSTKMKEKSFDILVENVPYFVKASPFSFNDEIRFYISVNSGEPHVFTWDQQMLGWRAIDDSSAAISADLEEKISQQLQGS